MIFKSPSQAAASFMGRLFQRAFRPTIQHTRPQAWGLLVASPGTGR